MNQVPDIQGRDYDPFYDQRQRFYTNVQQQVENEDYYPRNPIGQEDYMLTALDDMYMCETLSEAEAVGIFASWIKNRRPDTRVIHVKGKVSRPFYE